LEDVQRGEESRPFAIKTHQRETCKHVEECKTAQPSNDSVEESVTSEDLPECRSDHFIKKWEALKA
jgi:hypothetical protein